MFKHLLVPLDGSAFAEKALDYALSLASHYQSKVTLFHVLPPGREDWEAEMRAEVTNIINHIREQEKCEICDYLRAKEAEIQAQGIEVDAVVVSRPSVPEAILKTAEEEDVDTIVMSTHGLTGIQRWLLGSVAERVSRHASVPVLLIRSQEE
ncbi:MAG: universal stress protein [Caldilineae bacterium]|nr:MAG: universal stress protein [Caldilineae bacterium]